jgi:hypothetical protein
MKRFLLLLTTLLAFLATDLAAQPGGKGPKGRDSTQTASGAERVQALKVAFITQRLDLTSAEAEKFWPIYNEYQDQREAVRKQQQANRQKVREQADQLSEQELLRLADEEISLRKKDVDLQAEMHEKLKKVIPAKKLAQLYVAEEDFKKELLRILTEDNPGNKTPKGGN